MADPKYVIYSNRKIPVGLRASSYTRLSQHVDHIRIIEPNETAAATGSAEFLMPDCNNRRGRSLVHPQTSSASNLKASTTHHHSVRVDNLPNYTQLNPHRSSSQTTTTPSSGQPGGRNSQLMYERVPNDNCLLSFPNSESFITNNRLGKRHIQKQYNSYNGASLEHTNRHDLCEYNRLLKQKLNNVHASREKNLKNFKPSLVEDRASSSSSSSSSSRSKSESQSENSNSDNEEESSNSENNDNEEVDTIDKMVVNKEETAARVATAPSSTTGAIKSSHPSSLNRLSGLSSASRTNAAATSSSARLSELSSSNSTSKRNSSNNNNKIYSNSNNINGAGPSKNSTSNSSNSGKSVPMSKELKKSLINELLSIVTFAKSQGKDYAKKIDTLKQEANDLNKKRVDLSERDNIIK